MVKDFEPYRNLWITCSDWLKWYDMWMNDPISSIDAENIEKNVTESYKAMHKAIKQFADFESELFLDLTITLKTYFKTKYSFPSIKMFNMLQWKLKNKLKISSRIYH